MEYSPLIEEHPEWFEGGSWGMVDYGWSGNHKGLDEWWIETHVDYALDLGVDGYRLDVDIYRPDLWKEIKTRCFNAGHPIALHLEWFRQSDNVCDFYQHNLWLKEQPPTADTTLHLTWNVAQAFEDAHRGKYDYQAQISYHDDSVEVGSSIKGGKLDVLVRNQPERNVLADSSYLFSDSANIKLLVSNIDTLKYVSSISIISDPWTPSLQWNLSAGEQTVGMMTGSQMELSLKPFVPQDRYYCAQLSCHDEGWQGFPENENPYMAEGSRCLMGYSCLLTPAIPIFFSGEEFDANYVANPTLSPGLFGEGESGTGRWLYGAVVDWSQLKSEKHGNMLKDTKKMIAIRKAEKDLLKSYKSDTIPDIFALEFSATETLPSPYAIQNDRKIIIIAGNFSDQPVECSLKIPLQKANLLPDKVYKVYDLWNETTYDVLGSELEDFAFKIRADKTPGGGIAVFKINK